MKQSFETLVHLNHQLGKECAWCRQQTIESFSKYLLDEAHEVLEAIKQNDADELREELGDLLWNCIFMARLAEKEGLFFFTYVLQATNKKITRRHPQVFGEKTDDLDRIWQLYREIKAEEKKEKAARVKRPITGSA